MVGAAKKNLLRPGAIMVGNEIISQSKLYQTEYFNDFARSLDMHHTLGTFVELNQLYLTGITLQRSKQAGEFGQGEKRFMSALLPHMSRAMKINNTFSELRREKRELEVALDHYACGLILLDQQGLIQFVNKAANGVLESSTELFIKEGRLRIKDPQMDVHLHSKLVQTRRPSYVSVEERGRALTIYEETGSIELLMVPLVMRKRTFLNVPSSAAIFLRKNSDRDVISDCMLKELWDLTPKEIEFGTLVAKGFQTTEICDIQNVSINTLKTHMKHIFEKTACKTKSELMFKATAPILLKK